jgi:hypothetical protein
MQQSPLLSFHVITDDLVKLIAHYHKAGRTKEADALENTHHCLENLIQSLSEDIHVLKLKALTEATKAKMLEMELKKIYNELYKRDQVFANEMIVKSYLPTKKQVSEEVIIKNV